MTNDAARLALGTLTAVPVRPPSDLGGRVPGAAMLLAPLIGVVVGAAGAGVVLAGAAAGLDPPAVAPLVLAATALATRALHLDGLADSADGLAASYDPARSLDVMRRGDTGPAGVAAVVIVLLVQAGAIVTILDRRPPLAAAAAVTVALAAARLAVPVACRRGVPAARAEGLGAAVAGSVPRGGLICCALLAAAAGAVTLRTVGVAWWAGPAAVVASLAAAVLVVRRCVARFGGITGDVVGAAVEVAGAAALLLLAGV